MVSTCAATSWEQTKVDLEAHGTKRAEGIERLVKDKSAGITTLVTHKLDATGDKLDATGPKVRDAIVALVKSELRDMRSEVAVSWSSIVQAVRRMQQGLDDLDGSQRDMRSEVAVSWSSIIQSVRQMKADVGLSWGTITQSVRQLEKSLADADVNGPELRDKMEAIVEKVEAMQTAQSEMKTDVGLSWSTITQAVRQMQQGLAQSDQGSEVRAEMKAIADKVGAMKTEVGVSWGTITQAVRQMQQGLADSDSGELQTKLEAIAEKVEAMRTAQSEMRTDVVVSWGTITQAVRGMEKSLAESDQGSEVRAEMKAIADKVEAMQADVGVSWGSITQAVRQMQQNLTSSDNGELQTKLEAIIAKIEATQSAQSEMKTAVGVSWGTITQAVRAMEKSLADSDNGELQTKLAAIADKIEAVQTAQIEMRTDVGVSWSSIMQAVRAMEKSLAESDHGPELQAVRELQESLAASQRGAEEKLSALAALDTVASKVETMTEANETMRTELGVSWATIVQSVRQMRQSLSENMSSRGKPPHAAVGPRADDVGGDDQTAKLSRETLDAVAEVKATLDALAAKKGDDPRTLTEETLDAIAATVKRVVGTRVSSTSTAPPGPRITADIAPAASQMLPTAMDNPFFDDDSNNNNKQALVIDDDTRKMLSDDLRRELDAKLGNVLEEIKRFLDEAAAAAPQPPAPGPSKLEIAMEQKLEHVAQMFQELQLSKLERDQRQRSAKLLSTFLWRKMREKLRVETFYETLIEYEGDPTTETRTKVERQFESIFKISNTIPTHGRDGRPLEQSERMRMWYNSRVGMVRQIAANDRRGPPPNGALPMDVTEANMMSVIPKMRPAPRAKAFMSLGLNTSGEDFTLGLQTVADMCERHGVEVDAKEGGVTSENVFSLIDRLPVEVQEGATQALTTKRIGGPSSRVLVREDTFAKTVVVPGAKTVKSFKMSGSRPLSPAMSPTPSMSSPRPGSGRSSLSSTMERK
jgi:ketosteroid isomerase-like protein/uncharacterized protein YqgV (UPF0045/DUF77 family)